MGNNTQLQKSTLYIVPMLSHTLTLSHSMNMTLLTRWVSRSQAPPSPKGHSWQKSSAALWPFKPSAFLARIFAPMSQATGDVISNVPTTNCKLLHEFRAGDFLSLNLSPLPSDRSSLNLHALLTLMHISQLHLAHYIKWYRHLPIQLSYTGLVRVTSTLDSYT